MSHKPVHGGTWDDSACLSYACGWLQEPTWINNRPFVKAFLQGHIRGESKGIDEAGAPGNECWLNVYLMQTWCQSTSHETVPLEGILAGTGRRYMKSHFTQICKLSLLHKHRSNDMAVNQAINSHFPSPNKPSKTDNDFCPEYLCRSFDLKLTCVSGFTVISHQGYFSSKIDINTVKQTCVWLINYSGWMSPINHAGKRPGAPQPTAGREESSSGRGFIWYLAHLATFSVPCLVYSTT